MAFWALLVFSLTGLAEAPSRSGHASAEILRPLAGGPYAVQLACGQVAGKVQGRSAGSSGPNRRWRGRSSGAHFDAGTTLGNGEACEGALEGSLRRAEASCEEPLRAPTKLPRAGQCAPPTGPNPPCTQQISNRATGPYRGRLHVHAWTGRVSDSPRPRSTGQRNPYVNSSSLQSSGSAVISSLWMTLASAAAAAAAGAAGVIGLASRDPTATPWRSRTSFHPLSAAFGRPERFGLQVHSR